jgi:2-(1,2-epoxy-1,2-dihydrophenyl)acetyl-CoA isomerase
MSEARQAESAADEILVDLQDGIGRITMNRPEQRNPLGLAFPARMNAALDRLENGLDCRVIILTGNGPVFCGGAVLGRVVAAGEVDMEWQYQVNVRNRWAAFNQDLNGFAQRHIRRLSPMSAVHPQAGVVLANGDRVLLAVSGLRRQA